MQLKTRFRASRHQRLQVQFRDQLRKTGWCQRALDAPARIRNFRVGMLGYDGGIVRTERHNECVFEVGLMQNLVAKSDDRGRRMTTPS